MSSIRRCSIPSIWAGPLSSGAAAGLLLLVLGSCRSPLGGQDIDLHAAAHALPGVGFGGGLAQRIGELRGLRVDAELVLAHQELSDEGPRGDDWDQVWGGFRFSSLERDERYLYGRAGVTWLRVEGDPVFLDDPGDYGGIYGGLGYEWSLGPSAATGPELTLSAVDSEGDESGSGLVAEIAWRWVWHL